MSKYWYVMAAETRYRAEECSPGFFCESDECDPENPQNAYGAKEGTPAVYELSRPGDGVDDSGGGTWLCEECYQTWCEEVD